MQGLLNEDNDLGFFTEARLAWESNAMDVHRQIHGFKTPENDFYWSLPLPHLDPSQIKPLTTLVKFSKNYVWIKLLLNQIIY